jgi:hypothetical protein
VTFADLDSVYAGLVLLDLSRSWNRATDTSGPRHVINLDAIASEQKRRQPAGRGAGAALATATRFGSALSQARRTISGDARSHAWFLAYWVPVFAVQIGTGHFSAQMLQDYFRITFAVLLLLGLMMPPIFIARRILRLRDRGLPDPWSPYTLRSVARAVAHIPLVAQLPFFLTAFTSVKIALSRWTPFQWDTTLAEIDRQLHLGVDPGTALVNAFPGVQLLRVIDFSYTFGWNLFWYAAVFWVVFSPSADHIRTRFVASFVVVWVVVGNIAAGVFLSAGPAFYGQVTGDHQRFAAILTHLSSTAGHGSSIDFQRYLWHLHTSGLAHFASGISAFPSMHVAIPTLITLFVWRYNRWCGAACGLFTVVTLLSSAYLGWHYLIDGYAAIGVVYLIYRVAQRSHQFSFLDSKRGNGRAG